MAHLAWDEAEKYQNWYSFISKHYKDGIFVGDANTIFEEDEAFAHKLLSQGTTTIGAIIMHGKNEPKARF